MQFWHGSTDLNQNLSSTVSNAPPTWTCLPALPVPIPNPLKLSLHNTSADIWTAPLCSVCCSCANWRWSPLSPPLLPVWQRLTRVPFFLEPCGRMRAPTNRRHACWKWHETESVECVVKTCTCVCVWFETTEIWQTIHEFREICELQRSWHLHRTFATNKGCLWDVFQVCENVSRAWSSLWTGISEYSLNLVEYSQIKTEISNSVNSMSSKHRKWAFKLTML